MRVAVEGGGYRQACDAFYSANSLLTDSMLSFSSSLSGTGAMAGDDSGGTDWAASYDPAARDALQAGEDLVRSFATMANLLNASLVNHEGAESGARLYGSPAGVSGTDGDPDPDHTVSTVGLAEPPSAAGGTGDQPGWWGLIADEVGGLIWPDADTGRLREAGDRWRTQAQSISSMTSYCDTAAASVGAQTSPEVRDAVAACRELKGHVSDIATAYQDLGDACDDYAQQVDDHRDQVLDELKSFIAWSAGIQIVGGVATFFTVGLAQVPTQAAQAAKIGAAALKVRRILTALLAVAKTAKTVVAAIGSKIASVVAKLAKFLKPAVKRALRKTGGRPPRLPPTKIGSKIGKQMGKRGWTKESVEELMENPSRIVPTRDTRHLPGGGRMDDPATAFIGKDGHYVVKNDLTGDIVQVSNKNKPDWKSPFE